MMAGGAKVKVGIVGATGAVGEEIVKVRRCPWEPCRCVVAVSSVAVMHRRVKAPHCIGT